MDDNAILIEGLRSGRLVAWINDVSEVRVQVRVGSRRYDIDGKTCKNTDEAVKYAVDRLTHTAKNNG